MPVINDAHGWILETASTAYAVGVNQHGRLVLRYWGPRLPDIHDYPPAPAYDGWASFSGPGETNPEEYPAFGGDFSFVEACLHATFADGVRDVWLRYVRAIHTTDADALTIRMDDAHYPLRVYITYQVHAEHDLIERYVELQNEGNTPIMLERALSATWHLPPSRPYELLHYTGRWADEWNLRRESLPHGITRLDSKRGTSSHMHHPAAFVVTPHTTQTQGECWYSVMDTSGNWALLAEVTPHGTTRISMGLNDHDFAYRLDPGLTFLTPSVFVGWTDGGLQSASHRLHGFIRGRLPHPEHPRKVLYNSWEATFFNVDEASQKRYAEIAAELGVELFVMDDGWFHRRRDDTAGLGDWFPDAEKFPNGLNPLIEHVNRLGMDFGLWVEPEMVSPDSDLYRAHPDWVLHFPTRARTTARNQLVLNLARPDVQDYLIEVLSRLLRDHNIAFIKWDMNRNFTEAGWQTDREPREIWVRYVEGLYRVWGTLRERFPQVIWQSCSGGGGRADLGMLRLADQVWLSDNTEPTRRIPMQAAYLHVYPPNTMEAWVTDMGSEHLPLEFRFHVSMCGSLGVGANITRWDDTQKATAARLIAQYKELRDVIQRGKVYQHENHGLPGYNALQFVSQDGATSALFVFRAYAPWPSHPFPVRLRGLNAGAVYSDGTTRRSGAAWMNIDQLFEMGNFESRLIVYRREE
jgi:alpha-galactosidase